jgi:hypothetical protein
MCLSARGAAYVCLRSPYSTEIALSQENIVLFRDYHLFNPLNAKLNPNCHLLALLGDHHIFRVSGIRIKMIRRVVSAYYKVNKHMSNNYAFY